MVHTQGITLRLSRTIPLFETPGIPRASSAVRMAGSTNGSTMGRKNAPFVYRKRGVYYLQKRIPKELVGHYGRTFVRKSLRTKDRREASKLASQPGRGLAMRMSLWFLLLPQAARPQE